MGHSNGQPGPAFGGDGWVGTKGQLPQTYRDTQAYLFTFTRLLLTAWLYKNFSRYEGLVTSVWNFQC